MKNSMLLNLIPADKREQFIKAAEEMKNDKRTWNIIRVKDRTVVTTVVGRQAAEETVKSMAENENIGINDFDIEEAK